MTSEEIKTKNETEDAIFDEPVLLININKLYKQNMDQNEIYEATRKAWRIDLNRANQIRMVCSVYRGIIRGVLIVDHWFKSEERVGRKEFEGKIAEDKIRTKYINKSVARYWKRGTQTPIRYATPGS